MEEFPPPTSNERRQSWLAKLSSTFLHLFVTHERGHYFRTTYIKLNQEPDLNTETLPFQNHILPTTRIKLHRSWLLLAAIALVSTFSFLAIGRRCWDGVWPNIWGTTTAKTNGATSFLPRDTATNATLGFEKIYALTQGTSWRIDGLRAAATFTGLEIEEPRQPPISNDLMHAFQGLGPHEENRNPLPDGAALAWMAHINLLELVMQSRLSTALIVEDDVDWDVALIDQMPTISDVVRTFTGAPEEDQSPYGPNWDVLWLGHCGDHSRRDEKTPYLAWADETVIEHSHYAGWAGKWLSVLPERYRSLNPTHTTVCSFAYAVSYEGVSRVLKALDHGGNEAFDVALSATCRSDPDLRCYTVQPEIMHHYVPPEEDGFSSEVKSKNGEADLSPEEALVRHMGTTDNIVNSTRCHVLWDSPCIGNTWT